MTTQPEQKEHGLLGVRSHGSGMVEAGSGQCGKDMCRMQMADSEI